jgi:hypothetical protein
MKRGDLVFIDTNAIVAAHSTGSWNAVRNAFRLVTAEMCVHEATRPDRHGQVLIEKAVEALSLELEIHAPDDAMRFSLLDKLGDSVALDAGEYDLLALAWAQGRGIWYLCGPDKATLRALHCLGSSDRMISLEELMRMVGLSSKGLLPSQTKGWLEEKRTRLKLGDSLI